MRVKKRVPGTITVQHCRMYVEIRHHVRVKETRLVELRAPRHGPGKKQTYIGGLA